MEWHKFFKNLLIGQGHKEIFDVQWCADHATEKIFCKKSALAFTLLHSCLLADLKPIAAAADTFSKEMTTLAKTCGEKSLIKLGNKLYALICCNYIPGSSIATHVATFQTLYTSLKSALVGNENMKVKSTMAGIFFLRSFRNDNSLSLLVQNIYDMIPFSFEKLAAQMNIEHSHTKTLASGSVNAVTARSFLMQPNKDKFKAVPNSQQFRNVVPTKGRVLQPPNQSNASSLKRSRDVWERSQEEERGV